MARAIKKQKDAGNARRTRITWLNDQHLIFSAETKKGEHDDYIRKADGGSGYNAGASSEEVINSTTDGSLQGVEWTVGNMGHWYMIGLSCGDKDLDWSTIDFGLYCGNNGHLHIYEAGLFMGVFGTYQQGDRLAVRVDKKTITYHNGKKRLYSSKKKPQFPLNIDMAFWSEGAKAVNVTLMKKPDAALGVRVDTKLLT